MGEKANVFEELVEVLKQGFKEVVPFHKLLGTKIEFFPTGEVNIRLDMKEDLIGNVISGNLHGGVIATILDMAGGMTVALRVLKEMKDSPIDELIERYRRSGTVDMRVDFLMPGRGKYFTASADVLRTGKTVSVARMEMRDDQEHLIAAGTGTYIFA